MHDDAEIVEATLRATLADVLGIDAERVATFTHDTALFGALPELDSMAVATLLTELEDRLALSIDDDEVEAEMFDDFGSLLTFLRDKALR
jgi:acyl carrier protein